MNMRKRAVATLLLFLVLVSGLTVIPKAYPRASAKATVEYYLADSSPKGRYRHYYGIKVKKLSDGRAKVWVNEEGAVLYKFFGKPTKNTLNFNVKAKVVRYIDLLGEHVKRKGYIRFKKDSLIYKDSYTKKMIAKKVKKLPKKVSI